MTIAGNAHVPALEVDALTREQWEEISFLLTLLCSDAVEDEELDDNEKK